eukprot:6192416-Pleurochrysis_carterae.AAC.4
MAIPSERCACEIALRPVGSAHMSKSLVRAACAFTGTRDGAKEVHLPVAREGSKDVVDVRAHRVCLLVDRQIVGGVVVVTVVGLGEDGERRVEAEQIAVFVGVKHERLVELFGLEREAFEALVLEPP